MPICRWHLWSLQYLLHFINHQLIISPAHPPICQFPLLLLHSSPLTLQASISALFVIPSISPTHPSLPSTSAQGCQSFRDPVSCEIAQIAVALRLAQQQRGENERERERKESERFYASTLLNLNWSPPSLPLPPLIHSDMDKHTHSCKTAYLPTTVQVAYLPPNTHTQWTSSTPHHQHHRIWTCNHTGAFATLTIKTPPPLCFSVRVTSHNNSKRACSPQEG